MTTYTRNAGLAVVCVLLLGIIAISALGDDPEQIEVVPDSCVEAIDLSDEAWSLTSDQWGRTSQMMEALLVDDFDRFDRIIVEFDTVRIEIADLVPRYRTAAGGCLDAAGDGS